MYYLMDFFGEIDGEWKKTQRTIKLKENFHKLHANNKWCERTVHFTSTVIILHNILNLLSFFVSNRLWRNMYLQRTNEKNLRKIELKLIFVSLKANAQPSGNITLTLQNHMQNDKIHKKEP